MQAPQFKRRNVREFLPDMTSAGIIGIVLFVALMSWAKQNGPKKFHVRGKITDRMGFVLPGTQVVFTGQLGSRRLVVDKNGSYETELPFGSYSMTAEGPEPYSRLGKYERPAFQVTTPVTVTLNATLPSESHSCDLLGLGDDPEETENAVKGFCGGEDEFSIPMKQGKSIRLLIRYEQRRALPKGEYAYSSKETGPGKMPVFVFLNLFSIEANQVVYNPETRVLEATGDVLVADGSGKDCRFSAVRFEIREGKLLRKSSRVGSASKRRGQSTTIPTFVE